MKVACLQALVSEMTARPWTLELDRNDQQNIYSNGEWIALLPHQCVASIEEDQRHNAAGLLALANHADVLIELAAAVERRDSVRARRCFTGKRLSEDESRALAHEELSADDAMSVALAALEAIP